MSIWQRYAATRVTRRRAIAATGGLSLGAAFLAACGAKSGSSGKPASGLVSTPVDTTDKAKYGGTYQTTGTDPVTMNPNETGNRNQVIAAGLFYPKLLKSKVVKYPAQTEDYNEGDLAQSWELSPDKLTLTMKLRQGLKWDVTSGRTIDAQDVAFSWNKMLAQNPYRGNIAYSANPTQSILGVTAVDNNTITVNFHHPDPDLYGQLASPVLLVIMPREADTPTAQGGFDSKQTIKGYGPWRLKDYDPGVGTTWVKNPDYYVKGRPFFDAVRVNFVSEYATRLAQFRAGAIWSSQANLIDIIGMKREMPQLELRLGDRYGLDSGTEVIFSYITNGVSTPWIDQRMRQAISYLIDREEFRDYATNESKFSAEGIDVAPKAQGIISPGWSDYYIDPLDEKAFGPNTKFYKQDIAEAKKLMAAAGYTTLDTKLLNGADKSMVIIPQLAKGGVNAKYEMVPSGLLFSTISGAYNNGVNNGFGVYQGNLATRAINFYSSVGSTYAGTDLPNGRSFLGMTVDGKDPHLGDPEMTTLMTAIRQEFDKEKLKKLTADYQKAMLPKAYRIPFWWSTLADPGSTETQTMSLTWPVVGNLGVYRTTPGSYAHLIYGGVSPGETMLEIYQDDTKQPVSKS